ncbi:putative peptidoglycan binding domain protein [Enhygromyxa salina]|uniref:Putative peptidoglycan binding domain protein n=1 Tax=Enhygromyxa salina TaxID=215803 RepID=A0A2S9YAT1_9BACT|nr:peptidoglycan-binding domain-containing protein [Enhygromyxa salina]PRQ02213.1 putative peptidoglycan binding domain protein [Enhygromyxa salina]
MATITIEQGECLTSIALARGFDPQTIWDHPDNAELKQLRQTPQALLPGDRLVIPELEEKEESLSTGTVARFQLNVGAVKLRLRLTRHGEARADEPFELLFDGLDPITGTTDGEGWIDEPIPAHATRATLSLRDGLEKHVLRIGHLDPHDSPSGVQQRLRALGYYFGLVDGEVGDVTAAALRRFQTANELELSGEADDATISALRDAYGS